MRLVRPQFAKTSFRRTLFRRIAVRNRKPKGVAAVELAICLPVLVFLMLATIESCTMYYVQQTLKITAYEGARIGTVPTATKANVEYQCQTLLDDHGVTDYTITLDPQDPQSLTQGDYLTVTIEADFSPNSMVGGWIYSDKVLSRSVSLSSD